MPEAPKQPPPPPSHSLRSVAFCTLTASLPVPLCVLCTLSGAAAAAMRHADPDLLKAFSMHRNGMPLDEAWRKAGEPTTLPNAKRQYKVWAQRETCADGAAAPAATAAAGGGGPSAAAAATQAARTPPPPSPTMSASTTCSRRRTTARVPTGPTEAGSSSARSRASSARRWAGRRSISARCLLASSTRSRSRSSSDAPPPPMTPTATEARALGARGPGGWACARAHKGARCGRHR
mmetsp:Transcript_54962/g.163525  ORF Transcript_54962/g.163525 Transcript_54962/m.163525 type:complete len:235 (+) Transcript_54962:279-983(+)